MKKARTQPDGETRFSCLLYIFCVEDKPELTTNAQWLQGIFCLLLGCNWFWQHRRNFSCPVTFDLTSFSNCQGPLCLGKWQTSSFLVVPCFHKLWLFCHSSLSSVSVGQYPPPRNFHSDKNIFFSQKFFFFTQFSTLAFVVISRCFMSTFHIYKMQSKCFSHLHPKKRHQVFENMHLSLLVLHPAVGAARRDTVSQAF